MQLSRCIAGPVPALCRCGCRPQISSSLPTLQRSRCNGRIPHDVQANPLVFLMLARRSGRLGQILFGTTSNPLLLNTRLCSKSGGQYHDQFAIAHFLDGLNEAQVRIRRGCVEKFAWSETRWLVAERIFQTRFPNSSIPWTPKASSHVRVYYRRDGRLCQRLMASRVTFR